MTDSDAGYPRVAVDILSTIPVTANDPLQRIINARLCQQYPEQADFILCLDPNGLSLRENLNERQRPVKIDLCSGSNTGSNLLHRAIGIRKGQRPPVIDATAGFGSDAILLARSGCKVTALERNLVVAALLEDALLRARQYKDEAAERIQLLCTDAIEYLGAGNLQSGSAVIYLDPMFPERRKTALNRKSMRILSALTGSCSKTEQRQLLAVAISTRPQRVVVKRRRLDPPLADYKPHFSLSGRTIRFDIYIPTIENQQRSLDSSTATTKV